MSPMFFWPVVGPQHTAKIKMKMGTKKVPSRSRLLSVAANEAQQEGLRLHGSRFPAIFNK